MESKLMQNEIKSILSLVAEDDMLMVGPTIVDEIIDREVNKKEINFTDADGGYNLGISEVIISSLTLVVSMISVVIEYWKTKNEISKIHNKDEIDKIIITDHPEFIKIDINDRSTIISKIIKDDDI